MRILAVTRDLGGDERRQRVVDHLGKTFEVIRVPPRISVAARMLNLALSFYPRKATWREQSKKNAFYFTAMSRGIRRSLLPLRSRPDDIIMTFEALFAPGTGADTLQPFVMYEDGTSRMTLQRWPAWVPRTARTPRYRRLEEDAYRAAAHIFTTSGWVHDSLLQDYGMPAEHVSNVGQGHDFAPPAELSKCAGPILFVGYEFDRKGGPDLLEAFQRVRSRHPAAELALVGPDLSLSLPGVTVHGKVSNKDKLRDLFHRAGVFVLPSVFDPNPHAAMEAMSMGLPVVVSEGCGTREIIENGVSGFVVPVGNPAALAEALDRLLSEPGLRTRVGRAGAQRVHDTSSWPRVAEQITERLKLLQETQSLARSK